ncbi:MAG: hypothetical protein ABIU29_00185 [Chthoniobacterales bacterium]
MLKKYQSGLSTLRVVFGLLLITIGCSLAFLSYAASPPSGTITPTTAGSITWTGTGTGVPPAAGGEADCQEGANCDSFKLTLTGVPGDWAGKQVKVRIEWLLNSTDYDLAVHKGSIDGPLVASSGSGATTSEEAVLNPSSVSIGTGDFYVRAIYFAATPADQYNGSASVVGAGLPPAPAPTPTTGIAPRYQNYTPPAAGPNTLGIDAGEPSIGVNWFSEGILPGAGDDLNGGRSMYIALLETLRITFDDSCPSSPSALWEDKSFVTTSAITFDPILYTDRTATTGRTLVSQLEFPAGSAGTASAFTENDGETWVPSTGAGPGSGIDHQTIGGGGPFHAPLINPAYPNAIYYCGQLPVATCALSLDGGASYGPAVPVDTGMECGGLHGHIKVGPDGTAYLPNKGCGTGQAAIVSEDNGVNWDVRIVPGSTAGGSDAAVSIGRGDVVKQTNGDPIGRVYLGYADGNNRAVITTSSDRGVNWTQPLDVGAAFGVNNVVFPAVVAGDDDRAAFAFLGTPTAGGLQGPKFAGIWHLYVAHTLDGGQTWRTVDATPNDPLQRGCVWLGGGSNICRNMLDFMGIDVDKRGRVLVGYNDGCAGAECSQAAAEAVGNSYTSLAVVARQTAGKSLFAAEDSLFPDTSTVPGVPFVTALRNGSVVHLGWSTSNTGGSPVIDYTVERATTSGGSYAVIATVPGSQLRYDDSSATDTGVTYYYKVRAQNSVGTSCGNNEVPAPYVGDSSSTAGYRIALDPTGDQKNPAGPDLDVQTFSISEPSTGPNADKLVFQLKLSAPPSGTNEKWRIVWDSPNAVDNTQSPPLNVGQFYVGLMTDETGQVSYDYGTVETGVVGLVLGVPQTKPAGTPDSGSFDGTGLVTIVMSKDKLGNLHTGDLMGDFSVRTYQTPESNYIRTTDAIDLTSNASANDFTANTFTYKVVGPVPGLNGAVSRKVHGSAGTFDIDLPLVGSTGIECRTGGTGGNYQVVFTFDGPISLTNATVTAPLGGSVTDFSASGSVVTVNLQNITNAQTVTVTLIGLSGAVSGTVALPMGVLLGDTTADSAVNSADIGQTKSRSGQIVGAGNFRSDVTVDGNLNSADIGLVKSKSGTALGAPIHKKHRN